MMYNVCIVCLSVSNLFKTVLSIGAPHIVNAGAIASIIQLSQHESETEPHKNHDTKRRCAATLCNISAYEAGMYRMVNVSFATGNTYIIYYVVLLLLLLLHIDCCFCYSYII